MGIVIPEVLNHYNVYNDKAKKLIGISGEIELGELEVECNCHIWECSACCRNDR